MFCGEVLRIERGSPPQGGKHGQENADAMPFRTNEEFKVLIEAMESGPVGYAVFMADCVSPYGKGWAGRRMKCGCDHFGMRKFGMHDAHHAHEVVDRVVCFGCRGDSRPRISASAFLRLSTSLSDIPR